MTLGPRPNGANASVVPAAEQAPAAPDEADIPADTGAKARLKKSPSAFRTISEVADDLHIPQHVLRFWETKFPQVRPLKRGGGRRYYRPDDIALLRRISGLLYIQGFTIKGVQRLLRESGGRLSDDIPPPSGDERQDPALAGIDPELPLPGLGSLVPAGRAAQPLSIARSADRAGGPASLEGGPPADDHAAYEVVRLRRLLAEALVELQALRALLP